MTKLGAITIDGIELHPTKRIGWTVAPPSDEFITDLPCGDDGTIQVHLASSEAVAAIESRATSAYQESVFLVGIGENPVITVFISEPEYEEGFLYPSE